MKSGQYKGTPHPKKRQPLVQITNKGDGISSSKLGPAQERDKSSPMKRLHAAHTSVACVMGKIDSLMTGIHKRKLSEKLTTAELDNFSSVLINVDSTLQDWHAFFVQALSRPSAPPAVAGLKHQRDVHNDNLIPIASSTQAARLSDSPLVPGGRESRDDLKRTLRFTPEVLSSRRGMKSSSPASSIVKKPRFTFPSPTTSSSTSNNKTSSSTSNNKKVTFADTPETITPTMPSPPRSVRMRRPSTSSSSSSLSTPSIIRKQVESPSSVELATPEASQEIVNKYSWNSGSEKSLGVALSPPKTCTLLGSSGDHVDNTPVAVTVSPFRTQGLVLRSPSTGESQVSDSESEEDLTSKLSSMNI